MSLSLIDRNDSTKDHSLDDNSSVVKDTSFNKPEIQISEPRRFSTNSKAPTVNFVSNLVSFNKLDQSKITEDPIEKKPVKHRTKHAETINQVNSNKISGTVIRDRKQSDRKQSRKKTRIPNTINGIRKKGSTFFRRGDDSGPAYKHHETEILWSLNENYEPKILTPADFIIEKEIIDSKIEVPQDGCLQSIKLVRKNIIERAELYKESSRFKYQIKKFLAYVSDYCFKIVKNPVFESMSFIVIILNSLMLALADPTSNETTFEGTANSFFLVFYTIEMVLKIFAMGFILPKGSYLRDFWGVLDFIIVVSAYIVYLPNSSKVINLKALRSLRVLRPLRAISSINALRSIVVALVRALPLLRDLIVILLVFFLIFAIMGLQLFAGYLKRICFSPETGMPYEDETGSTILCGYNTCPSGYVCGKSTANPDFDVSNFDTVISALIISFQIVTMEGWSSIMEYLEKAYTPVSISYCVTLVFIGGFFLLNIFLAVIKEVFTTSNNNLIHIDASQEDKFQALLQKQKQPLVKLLRNHRIKQLDFDKLMILEDGELRKIDPELLFQKKRQQTQKLDEKDDISSSVKKQRTVVFEFNDEPSNNENKERRPRGKSSMKKLTHFKNSLPSEVEINATPILIAPGSTTVIPLSQQEKPSSVDKIGEDNDQVVKFNNVQSSVLEAGKIDDEKEIAQINNNNDLKFVLPNQLNLSEENIEENEDNLVKANKLLQINSQNNVSEKTPVMVNSGSMADLDKQEKSDKNSSNLNKNPAKGNILTELLTKLGRSSRQRTYNFSGIPGISSEIPKPTSSNNIELIRFKTPINSEKFGEGGKPGIRSERKTQSENLKETQIGSLFSKGVPSASIVQKPFWSLGNLSPSSNRSRSKTILESTTQTGKKNQTIRIKPENIESDHKKPNPLEKVADRPTLNIERASRNQLSMNRISSRENSKNKEMFIRTSNKSRRRDREFSKISDELNGQSQRELLFNHRHVRMASRRYRTYKAQNENLKPLTLEEQKTQKKKFFFDLRYWKAWPVNTFQYQSDSYDNVLPSFKKKALAQKEEQTWKRIRSTRIPSLYLPRKLQISDLENIKALNEKNKLSLSQVPIRQKETSSIKYQIKATLPLLNEKLAPSNQDPMSISKKDYKSNIAGTSDLEKSLNTVKRKGVSKALKVIEKNLKRRATHTIDKNALGLEEDEKQVEMIYEDLCERIDAPIEYESTDAKFWDRKNPLESVETTYRELRLKDLQEKRIKEHHFSGLQILRFNFDTVKMNFIRKAMAPLAREYKIWYPGLRGLVIGTRNKIRVMVNSSLFANAIIIVVILNTVALSLDGVSPDIDRFLNGSSLAFTLIFSVEMSLKLIGLGTQEYSRDKMNLLDAMIVMISILEQVLATSLNSSQKASIKTMRVLRTFQVLRITKLLRSLTFMRVIIGVISRSIKNFIYIALLLFILIFIYTLLGMQIFAGQFNFPNNPYRENFDTFFQAFLTVFQLMTIENWNEVLYLMLHSNVSKGLSMAYLISWIFIGNYVFLNLFLAIILDEFTSNDTEEQEKHSSNEIEDESDFDDEAFTVYKSPKKAQDNSISKFFNSGTKEDKITGRDLTKQLENHEADETTVSSKPNDSKVGKSADLSEMGCEKSVLLFSKSNFFRKFCFKVVKHNQFENFTIVVILLSSLELAIDTYFLNATANISTILARIDIMFNVLFIIESCLKIVSYGFVLCKGSYLRDNWNILDFSIVAASVVNMSLSSINIPFVKVFRLLRTLRPLRFMSHNENMRMLVTALIQSVGSIANVIIVMLIIGLMFAILGQSILSSKLGYCQMPPEDSYYGISEDNCIARGYTWSGQPGNFDNVVLGLRTLFLLSTQENWPNIMTAAMDSNDPDQGPILNVNWQVAFFFLVFMLVGTYFLVNLFIGVIFLRFTKNQIEAQKNQRIKGVILTDGQRKWIEMQRLILLIKPDFKIGPPQNKYRLIFYRIVMWDGTGIKFELCMMATILCSTLTMALSYEGSSHSYDLTLNILNYIFTAIFVLECIIRIIALGFKRYWINSWNRFDFFIVMSSVLDISLIISLIIMGNSQRAVLHVFSQFANAIRVLRVARLLKLLKNFAGIEKIIQTLILSLPSLINVLALLFLVFFTFSIIAVFLFSDVTEGNIIDGYVNFKTFGTAMLTLFRCSTGENWWTIMLDTMYPTLCKDGTTNCGSSWFVIFWLIFITVAQFILLNLFVLVVLEQFEIYYLNPNNPMKNFKDNVQKFKEAWKIYSIKFEGQMIKERTLIPFFASFKAPLGFKKEQGKQMTQQEMAKEIIKIELEANYDGFVSFNAVIFGALKRAYGYEVFKNADYAVREYVYLLERKTFKNMQNLEIATYDKKDHEGNSNFKSTVNPFVKYLFMRMALLSWMGYAKKKTEKSTQPDQKEIESCSESSLSGSLGEYNTSYTSGSGEDSYGSEIEGRSEHGEELEEDYEEDENEKQENNEEGINFVEQLNEEESETHSLNLSHQRSIAKGLKPEVEVIHEFEEDEEEKSHQDEDQLHEISFNNTSMINDNNVSSAGLLARNRNHRTQKHEDSFSSHNQTVLIDSSILPEYPEDLNFGTSPSIKYGDRLKNE